jgi:thioredoxin 1
MLLTLFRTFLAKIIVEKLSARIFNLEADLVRTFDTPITTSDQSVERVLKAGLPVALVLLDGTPTAGMEQSMNQIARQNAGDLLVVKMQIKDNPETTQRLGIQRGPAVVTFKAGEQRSKAEGISVADLEKHTNYLLGKGPRPVQQSQPRGTSQSRPSGGARSRPQSGPRPASGDGRPQTVTDASFEQEVMRSPIPVLVDFWAPWCGPCRMTEPIVEKLAHELNGRLKVAKVNVDENPMVAGRYGVQSIPTMMVVKNGQIADRWVGALPEPAMRSRVAPHV